MGKIGAGRIPKWSWYPAGGRLEGLPGYQCGSGLPRARRAQNGGARNHQGVEERLVVKVMLTTRHTLVGQYSGTLAEAAEREARKRHQSSDGEKYTQKNTNTNTTCRKEMWHRHRTHWEATEQQ